MSFRGTFGSDRNSQILGYLVAIVSVLSLLVVRDLLQPYLGTDAPLLVFLLAVMISSRVGGAGPGFFATAISTIIGTYFFIQPVHSFRVASAGDRARIVLFMIESIVFTVLNSQLRQNKRRLEISLKDEVRAREEANESNKAKSHFLATMSHEIRTPMTAIMGFLDLLEIPEESEQNTQYLEIIRRNGKQLLALIDDILDLARIEKGKIAIEKRVTTLPHVIGDLKELFSRLRREKAVELETVLDPKLPKRILTDEVRLRQILYNLLGNAVKFTEAGSIRLGISCDTQGSNPFLKFEFRDSGIGISPEQAARLFKPFSQADETINRKFGGTGIGLAVSQSIARTLGGDLVLQESKPGLGSVFALSIPLESVGNRLIDEAPKEFTAACLQRLKVLLVDDSQDIRRYLQTVLKPLVAEIGSASNGRQALDLASHQTWDIILMDIEMPEMDGYMAARELRKRGFKNPIVALTAHAMTDVREKCLQAGYTDKITKPIEKMNLLMHLAEYCQD